MKLYLYEDIKIDSAKLINESINEIEAGANGINIHGCPRKYKNKNIDKRSLLIVNKIYQDIIC